MALAKSQITPGSALVSIPHPSPEVHSSDLMERRENPQISLKEAQNINIPVLWRCFARMMNWCAILSLILVPAFLSSNSLLIKNIQTTDDSYTGARCSRTASSMWPLSSTRFLLRCCGPVLLLGPANPWLVAWANILFFLALTLTFILAALSVTAFSSDLQRHLDSQSYFHVVSLCS